VAAKLDIRAIRVWAFAFSTGTFFKNAVRTVSRHASPSSAAVRLLDRTET
jgi:hypothetical protein